MSPGPGSAPGLLEATLADVAVDSLLDDRALLAGMLRFESALASAAAQAGLIPQQDAVAIQKACLALPTDPSTLAERTRRAGSPVLPLMQDLCQAVGESASRSVHFGATTQDTVDTALALAARDVIGLICDSLLSAADQSALFAEAERNTLMVGRTLGQHAQPTTFGLKAAGWCEALWEAHDDSWRVLQQLAVQLGGAAGTLGAYGDHGAAVVQHVADSLGLRAAVLPWHSDRTRIARLTGALAEVCGVWSKIAADVVLLAQTEVAEVSELVPGGGRSSAMPHKRNPAGAIAIRAGALRAPALASSLFSAMAQENERGIGTWQAEWLPLRELLRLAGTVAARGDQLLRSLAIDREQMARNLQLTHGLTTSEQLAMLLAPTMGKVEAQAVVAEIADQVQAGHGSLAELAARDDRVRNARLPEDVARLLDPELAARSAGLLVDRALAAHRARKECGGGTRAAKRPTADQWRP